MSKFMSLEQTIRKLGAKSASQPLEKDMNDQVHAGSYSSKHFEVSAPAQKLYASLPKEVNPDDAEKSVQLHDKLFAIHKKTSTTERSTSSDVKDAQRLHDEIMKLAKDMGLENKHGHVKDSLEHIKKYVDTQVDSKDVVTPEDVAKRFATTPKDYQTDVKADSDIDNIAKFRITRDKKGQRKLKIIDDEYNLGATRMDRIENVSPSFLEALKQVQENENELLEKKKMTKADIAALKEPKGSIDANDLAALRAGEHKKKKVEEAKAMHNYTPEGINCPVCGMKACPPKSKSVEEGVIKDALKGAAKETLSKYGTLGKALAKKIDSKKTNEEVEDLDEAQFIVIQKGMDKKRIRNNPVEIMRARKDGWAIREEVETVDEANELKSLAKSQAAATVKREVGQKKAMFAKKDAADKQKFSKSMQSIKAGDEVEMNGNQIDEALSAAHKSAITKHVKKMWGKGNISFDKQDGNHFVSHSDGIQTHVHSINMKKGVPHVTHFMSMDESVEQIDELTGYKKKKLFGKNPLDAVANRAINRMKLPPDGPGKLSQKDLESNKKTRKVSQMAFDRMGEEVELDEVLDTDEKKMAYAKKASDQIKSHIERGGAYDTSAQGEKDAKGVEKRTKGLQSLVKKIQKKTNEDYDPVYKGVADTQQKHADEDEQNRKIEGKKKNRINQMWSKAAERSRKKAVTGMKESFMERAIAILGEEYSELSFEQLVEEVVKRGRGRPRKNPLPDPNAPKRGRGRPKKGSSPVSTSTPAKPGAASTADTDKDREHIVMALRKSISSRGQHHVKFADGNSHQVPAEHAQKALKMHDSLNRPSEKMVFARKLAASHSSFKKALDDKNPGSEEAKKSGITLAKRAD